MPPDRLPDRLSGDEVRRHDARLRALLSDPGYVDRDRISCAEMEGFTDPHVFLGSDLDDPDVTVR